MRKILLLALALGLTLGTTGTALADGAKKAGTVTYDINLKTPDGAKTANVYLPYPMSDQNQDISDVRVSGNYDNQAVYHDPKTGSNYLMATWGSISGTPKLTFSFHVDSHYKKGGTLKDSGAKMPVDVLPYLAANDYLPSDNPKVKALAEKAVKGKKGTLARARAVYDWTIANTHRDNSVKGCGLGQAIRTLTEANGGGKCADISSVFITVARAAGIPARDVFGLRTKGKDGAITGDFHCWAEFYLPGTGWVQVDPADVRKAMLNEKLERILVEKRDMDMFLRAIAPRYIGVYAVDNDTGRMRSIVIPDRFRRIVKEAKGLFIPALAQYAEEVVADAWRGSFDPLLDLPGVIRRVEREGMVCATFRRRDGAWIRLQVMRYLPDEDEGGGTLWIFSAADADEQRA